VDILGAQICNFTLNPRPSINGILGAIFFHLGPIFRSFVPRRRWTRDVSDAVLCRDSNWWSHALHGLVVYWREIERRENRGRSQLSSETNEFQFCRRSVPPNDDEPRDAPSAADCSSPWDAAPARLPPSDERDFRTNSDAQSYNVSNRKFLRRLAISESQHPTSGRGNKAISHNDYSPHTCYNDAGIYLTLQSSLEYDTVIRRTWVVDADSLYFAFIIAAKPPQKMT